MKYICMLPAEKNTSKKQSRTQTYNELFWVIFLGDCAGLLGSSQGSWSTACTSSCHIPACVGGKMCCRGCFIHVHEMFTLPKFALCVYNFRRRQMALRRAWCLQQVFEMLLPFLSPWVKFPGVKFLITPASFQTWALYLLLCLKQVLCWESRDCCSLAAWVGAAAASHSAERDLGTWHQTAPPWDAPVTAGLEQPGFAVHWCPRVPLSVEFARLNPCRMADCIFSLYHDPPRKTVCDNITRSDQRGIIYVSWNKQKSCSSQCKSRNTNPGCQGAIAARLLMSESSEPIRITVPSCCGVYIY